MKKTGLNRDGDKYYTINEVVEICMKKFIQHVKVDENDICIESSAGNGAFIFFIKKVFHNYEFYDIEPEHKEIIKQDYLLLDTKKFENKNVHVIGNPPFGRQSSLAIKFIKKSTEFCRTLSFILPKSFKKKSMQKYFPLHYHMECEVELPKNSFTIENKIHDVPCIFQIWIKKDASL